MRKRVALVTIVLTVTLLIASAVGNVHAQERDPSEYDELNYNMPTLGWDAPSYDAGPPISEQLARIGIKCVDQPTEEGVMYDLMLYPSPEGPDQPRPYDMYEMSHGYNPIPNHLYWKMHSENDLDWGDNIYNLHDDEMDSLLDAMNKAETVEELHERVNAVQIRWGELLPYIPLYVNDDVRAIGSKWKGYVYDIPGGAFNAYWNYLTPIRLEADDGDTEFVMAYPRDLDGTNPVFDDDGRSQVFMHLVYASLLAFDKNLDPIPWLATDWNQETVGGKTVVTFTIRNNVLWHDNTPVTGEDVAFSFLYGREADPSTFLYQSCRHIENAVADGNTVTITMNSVRAWTLFDLGQLWILPKHIWEGVDSLDDRWNDPDNIKAHTGCGPFKYVSRLPDESYTVERWAKFWEPAKIKTFRMRVLATSAARFMAISTGDVDTERYNLDVAMVKTAQNTPGVTVISSPDIWDYVLGFNLETPGLDDYEVRKAIAYAIDKEEIVKRAMLGWGTVTDGPVPSAFYPSWSNPETPQFTTGDQATDIEEANKILDAAGYIDVDDDGIREFPGVTPVTTGPVTITETKTVVAEFSLRAISVFAVGMVTVLLIRKRKKT